MDFWWNLAKEEASKGNDKGAKNALQWAQKHAAKAERTVTSSEIDDLLTPEKVLEFNTARLGYYLEIAKTSACSRLTMEYDLELVKEFAASVGIATDGKLDLQMNEIRSLCSDEREREVATLETHQGLKAAAAAAEKGNMEEMARKLSYFLLRDKCWSRWFEH